MSEINYNAFTLLQQAKVQQNGTAPSRPQAEIKRELRRMGLKRTPGTNGEGRTVTVRVGNTEYKILAVEI